jgi:hypothetical protein
VLCHSPWSALLQHGAKGGDPLSWRHFQYGLAYLGRDYLLTQRQAAEAMRMAQANKGDYTDWHRDIGFRLTPHLPD